MTPQITPLPWKGDNVGGCTRIYEQGFNPGSRKNDGWIVCELFGPDKVENQKFILECVNSHAQLVEALKRLLKAEKAFNSDDMSRSDIIYELELAELEAQALLSTLEESR